MGSEETRPAALNQAKAQYIKKYLPLAIVFLPLLPVWLLARHWDWKEKPFRQIVLAATSNGTAIGFLVGLIAGLSGAPLAAAGLAAFVASATGVGLIVVMGVALITVSVLWKVRGLERQDYFKEATSSPVQEVPTAEFDSLNASPNDDPWQEQPLDHAPDKLTRGYTPENSVDKAYFF
mgnify:CR=1 FL=1